MIFQIIISILALSFVVFIHELGHFIAAKLVGVEVLAFSIGWGPVLFRTKRNNTEYRLSLLPFGGYCSMKGEQAFSDAIEKNLDFIPKEEHSFYGVHPFKRILIAFSGPFANILLAFFAFFIVNSSELSYKTYSNKIIPISTIQGEQISPARKSGLEEGDIIVSLDNKKIKTFYDIQKIVTSNPEKTMNIVYERNTITYSSTITTLLDKQTGTGKIGVYPYIPLEVFSVKEGSAASIANIKAGDIIIACNDIPINHLFEFESLLETKPEQVTLTLNRNNVLITTNLVLLYKDVSPLSDISWVNLTITDQGESPLLALKSAFKDTVETFSVTIKSIGILFKGVNVTEAVSGPIRITLLIADVARSGIVHLFELIAIICISLFIMNLLPIPILDGGIILVSIITLIKRKQIKPKILYYVQFIGVAFILFLLVFAIFGDIQYLIK